MAKSKRKKRVSKKEVEQTTEQFERDRKAIVESIKESIEENGTTEVVVEVKAAPVVKAMEAPRVDTKAQKVVDSLNSVIEGLNDLNEVNHMGHVHTLKNIVNNMSYAYGL